jgi:predicted dehydrogenase
VKRVAVVGLDHYHVTGWVETLELFADELQVVALYDPDPAQAARRAPSYHDPSLRSALGRAYADLPFETDLEALIANHDLDLALVTLPNRDAPAAIEGLARAGIHQVVDKPASIGAAGARRAFDVAREAGVRIVVGLTRRYSPAARAARDAIASGRLGRIVAADAVFATSSVAVRGPDNPLFSRELSGGGILTWLGIHDVDALIWLVGEPVVEVGAMMGAVGDRSIGVEDVSSVALRFAGGAIATLHHAYALPARGYRSLLAVRGTDRSVELGLGEDLVLIRAGRDGFVHEERTAFRVEEVGGYGASGRAAVVDLLTAIDEGRDPVASGRELVGALEVIDAAYEAAKTGRHVRLG